MKKIVSIIALLCLTGCAWVNQKSYEGRAYFGITKENLVFNDESSLKDSGIIIGRVTRENDTGVFADYTDRLVIFKNLNTGQELSYYDADYFYMRLPEGLYEISGFETKMRLSLRPINDGFKFKVKNGEIVYIGSIIGEKGFKKKVDSDFDKTLNQMSPSKIFYGSYSGGASLFIPQGGNYTFYVINDKNEVAARFYKLFPNLENIEIKTDLMN